ncbi:lactate utilization protein [Candidatus Sumerlaeota bacterium]|nr:lactate utilization protein [Candidatus Sumerlaeota bacterium]
MNDDLVERFHKKYEVLSGKVKIASVVDDAVAHVVGILNSGNVTCIAVSALPEFLQRPIEEHCSSAGIEVLKPPFRASQLPGAMDRAQVGITVPDFVIAETGTLVEFATDDAARLVSTLPRLHIGIVWAEQLVAQLTDAAPRLRAVFSENTGNCVATFISGPSRTADIEMKLTLGVHGPEEAHAIVIMDRRPADG